MIEFGARLSLKDNMYASLQRNLNLQRKFSEQIERTSSSIRGLGNQKANPTITANDRASGIIANIKNTVEMVSSMVASPEVEVEDEASKKVENIISKVRECAKQVASPVVRLKDSATSAVGKIKQKLKDIATNYTPIVKIRDLATQGISKIKNTLGGLGKKIVSPFVKLKDGASKVLGSIKNTLKSVGSMVAKPMVAIKDGATKILGSIGDKLKSLAKGVTVAVSVAGGAVLGGALNEGAKLQQSKGGIETLFTKTNADGSTDTSAVDQMLKYANEAYNSTGLSANAYMENVTSFSASLLSSLGGDTNKAAEVANAAMIAMADNSNKMGTDMESIQNAYQGFAKQNYTMLDNLKLGYGGTKEEMARLLTDAQKFSGVKYDIDNLADVYSAIGVIQDNLGITGTTAKEASATFSGSFAAMKASAQNVLANLSIGDGDAVAESMGGLISSASDFFFGNFVPMLQTMFSNLPSVVSTAITTAAPMIKENVLPLITSIKDGIFTGLSDIGIDTGALQAVFDQLFDVDLGGGGILGIFDSMKNGIVQAINTILPILPPIISAVQQIAPQVMQVVDTVLNGVGQIIPYLTPVIQTITNVISTAMPVIQQIITTVVNAVVAIMPTLSSIFQFVGNVIQQVLTVIGNHMGLFQTIVQVVVTVVSTVWQALAPVISAVVDVIITVVDGLLTGIETVFDFLAPYISTIWESICGFFSSASDTITTIIETLKSIFQGLFDAVSNVFGNIQDTVSSVMDSVTGAISGAIDTISGFIDKIGGAISSAKEFLGSGISKVKGALGFAYGKDRVPYNNYPAVLHEGEKVLTRNQADQYERLTSTRGVPVAKVESIGGEVAQSEAVRASSNSGQEAEKISMPEVHVAFNNVNISNMGDLEEIGEKATSVIMEHMIKGFRKVIPNMA